jgi:hypothetical protein
LRLRLESATDVIDLDQVFQEGRGIQAISGATGLGLPAKQVQWMEGAGDGSTARGRRALARDIDLPLYLLGADRTDLRGLMSRLSKMLARPMTLVIIDADGTEWIADVDHVGGGDFAYGKDTIGNLELFTSITLRSGDPFFTTRAPIVQGIRRVTGRGLLPKLANLELTDDQAIGTIKLNNPGDQSAHVVWTIHGPGDTFIAESPTGQVLQLNTTLTAGQTITIDTKYATVVDQDGNNRYADLAPAPRFWQVEPGISVCNVSIQDVDNSTYVTAAWYPRTWTVI